MKVKKIIIVGSTGSGKSILAKQLSSKLGVKHIALDALFWKANWGESSDEEFFSKIESAVSGDTWVVDGNYGRTNHLTWPKADTVIWIDLPFWLTAYQNISRSIKRAITREELWEGTGNRESFLRMFSKHSIVLWLLKVYKSNIKRFEARMSAGEYAHITFYRLRSRREVKNFLNGVQKRMAPDLIKSMKEAAEMEKA